jgi:hypothetical protein
MKSVVRDTRGVIYVEFLITFIPVFLMFLGMVQMGLMFVGGIAVQRAAAAAARAAAVVLDDDPQYYAGEPRMQIEPGAIDPSDSAEHGLLDAFALLGISSGSRSSSAPFGTDAETDSARLRAIRSAASIPLLAVAPSSSVMSTAARRESVMGAIGRIPASRAAFGVLYHQGALAVRLVDGAASETDVDRFEPVSLHEDGTLPTPARVRVTYLFHCAVPLANRLMCNDPLFVALGADGAAAVRSAEGTPSPERVRAIARQRELEQRRSEQDALGWSDLPESARTAIAGLHSAGMQARVKVMSAEAQLPIHYANYRYQSESGRR